MKCGMVIGLNFVNPGLCSMCRLYVREFHYEFRQPVVSDNCKSATERRLYPKRIVDLFKITFKDNRNLHLSQSVVRVFDRSDGFHDNEEQDQGDKQQTANPEQDC